MQRKSSAFEMPTCERNRTRINCLASIACWICEQCGEPLFEEQAVEAIKDIVKAVDEKWRRLQRSVQLLTWQLSLLIFFLARAV